MLESMLKCLGNDGERFSRSIGESSRQNITEFQTDIYPNSIDHLLLTGLGSAILATIPNFIWLISLILFWIDNQNITTQLSTSNLTFVHNNS